MQDDPDRGECFQDKMILKRRQRGEGTLRLNASHHGACSTSYAGRREFVASSGSLSFTGAERTLQAREYLRLSKKDKRVVRRYLATLIGAAAASSSLTLKKLVRSRLWPPLIFSQLPASQFAAG